jgi:hypothetical protein
MTTKQNAPSHPATAPAVASRPAPAARPTSQRPAARKAAPANTPADADPHFVNGPLAGVDVDVDVDGQVLAYCVGGLVLDVQAPTPAALQAPPLDHRDRGHGDAGTSARGRKHTNS